MTEYDFDAIVVGSGMSGGWAAKEFTESGLKTLVIERGNHVEPGEDYISEFKAPWEFPYGDKVPKDIAEADWPIQKKCYAFKDSTKHFFTKDSEHKYVQDKPFDWIKSFSRGGKSKLWHRQSYRWSDHEFGANALDGHGCDWPIRYKDIAPWYDYVERFAGISGNDDGLEGFPSGVFQKPYELNAGEKYVRDRMAKAYTDRHLVIGRTAHLTEPTQEQMDLGRGQCQSRNECQRGCSFGAFFSSLSATLPAAKRTGNLTEVMDTVVHSVIYDEVTGKASGVRVIHAKSGEHRIIRARVIFMCASTLGSTQILLNSKSKTFPGGIGNSSGVLGHYLMDHLYQAGARGDIPGLEDRYYQGRRPVGVIIPRFRNIGSDKADFLRGYGFQGSASRASWKNGTGRPGIGVDYKASMRTPGKWSFGIQGSGEMLPVKENHVSLDAKQTDEFGMPLLRTSCAYGPNDEKMYDDIQKTAREILQAVGVQNVETYRRPTNPGIAIHEVGTARMGRDPKTSYLNGFNQSHEVSNLFVTDGSAFASIGWVNPSLTFMALTARAVDYAVNQMKEGVL